MEMFLQNIQTIFNQETIFLVVLSAFFGLTMKFADVFDEHGVKEFFPGCRLLSGFLWGIFGAIIVWLNASVGTVLLAMVLAYLVRLRLDYRNHSIGGTLVIISSFIFNVFIPKIFFFFFSFFLSFGLLKDYFQDYKGFSSEKLKKNIFYNILIWFYPLSSFIYGILYNRWEIFISLCSFNIFYALVKIYYQKRV